MSRMEDSKKWYMAQEWCENHHQEFYDKLKELTPEEQSKAIITQASTLTLHGEEHHGNYQAAESLMNFWIKNLASDDQKDIALQIVADIRKRMKKGVVKDLPRRASAGNR